MFETLTQSPDPRSDRLIATDASLLVRFQTGESNAATELYKRYADRLLNLASARLTPDLKRRLDPEDIVQSVFRTFFRRAALGQYEVPNGEDIWKLFLVIGLNKIRKVAIHHHAAKRDLRMTTGGEVAEQAGCDDGDIALTALRMTIDELLAPLPRSYREIVELRIEQHEVAEIAARTNRSKRSVERILREFQDRLHGLIDEQ